MSSFAHPIAISAPFARSVAIAALMGATMLASPLTAARGDTATDAAIRLAQAAAQQNPAATGATEGRGETVEAGIIIAPRQWSMARHMAHHTMARLTIILRR